MSGITPILDTLLHQVLGKRVDVPLARQIPEPVRPLSPAEAPPAVRSDSRLDPRTAAPLPDLTGANQRARAPQTPAPPPDAATGSTQTHFSAAARTIADILARYPAPPSAVRPAAPLMSAADAEAPTLANRLQASVGQSGLFYESHLQSWYRGEMSGARLAQEPQMRLSRPPETPAAGVRTEGGKGPAPATAAAEAPSQARAAGTPVTDRPAAAPAPAEGRPINEGEEAPRPAPRPLSDDANQALQGILRHQLETLATPVLRWEGDVWSGIFMALVIQVPAEAPRQAGAGGDQGEDDEDPGEESTWRSELTVELASLGPVRVRLDLRGDTLSVDLDAHSEPVAEQLRIDSPRLKTRLEGCGFEQVRLRVMGDERP
ncbi:MAG: hypothetical protein FH757_01195 [Alcanivorax sp.]|nr:hypothetical protein [Alcanivorax sp.]